MLLFARVAKRKGVCSSFSSGYIISSQNADTKLAAVENAVWPAYSSSVLRRDLQSYSLFPGHQSNSSVDNPTKLKFGEQGEAIILIECIGACSVSQGSPITEFVAGREGFITNTWPVELWRELDLLEMLSKQSFWIVVPLCFWNDLLQRYGKNGSCT